MMLKTPVIALSCVALMGAFLDAQAALVDWGTRAGTSVARCPSFCTDFTFGPTLGGVNEASSGISSVSNFRGSARASASLSGALPLR